MALTAALARNVLVLGTLGLWTSTWAHEHHEDKIPEGKGISPDPIDSILWIHILLQLVAWGIIFPTGMVLGLVRSRWHVPVQSIGVVLAIVAYFIGHAHKGRQFGPNAHAKFAPWISFLLAAQVLMGIYLKLHLTRGLLGRIRKGVILAHGIVGKALPVASWVQMVFGGIAAAGYCRGDHLGQCLAHFIMGSAFVAYGILATILLLVGQPWLRRTGRSQEFFDSLVITLWGCVNTFTEHRWGQPWRGNDLQHTSMGIVWWCAGLLGMWLSRSRDGRPRRNVVPGVVIFMTGWAMGAHSQHLPLSAKVHTTFGYTLMAAGAARIVEVSFLLRDRPSVSEQDPEEMNSFQFLIPFLLVASGFLFMGATEEQMAYLSGLHVTHVSYILILFSLAFMLCLFVALLLHLFAQSNWPLRAPSSASGGQATRRDALATLDGQHETRANGTAGRPGHAPVTQRDAEEFELEGLISEDEEGEDSGIGRKKYERAG